MKKLLSLLSILTISGTALPSVIAASSYKKEETIINNIENLKRTKRNVNNFSDYKFTTDTYFVDSNTNSTKQTDVPYPVTTMYTFTSDGGNRKKGDIYFGTTNGVYLRKNGENTSIRIKNINGTISIIQNHLNDNVHVITITGAIYFVDSNTNSTKQNDVPYPVTTMYTFTSDGGNRKAGDIYFGTNNGVYLRKAGELTTTKINGINEPIKIIQEYKPKYYYDRGSVHVITLRGDIYYVNNSNVVFKQNDVPYPVTTMYTFTSDGGNRKAGDIYFGTNNGVYLRKAGELTTTKINGIDGAVGIIQNHLNDNVHVIKLKIYTKNNLNRKSNIPPLNSVPSVRQTEKMLCGPAVGEAVLRYFGFNFNGENSFSAQTTLSNYMSTQAPDGEILGTTAVNWANTINNYINEQNLNNQRHYSLHRLGTSYRNNEQFYHFVSDSLENNMPVAFASSSRIDRYDHVYSPHYNHFILITSVRPSMPNGLSQHNYIYTYMDPDDGTFHEFNWSDILQRTSGPDSSYLISYSPDTQEIETNMRQLSLNNERISEERLQERAEEINNEVFMGTAAGAGIIGLFYILISLL